MDFQPYLFKLYCPLINGLVFKKKYVRGLFHALDWFCLKSRSSTLPSNPSKILVSNLGNLGDVLICFQTINALKDLYPKACFGFLVSPVGLPALEIIDKIQRIHVFDHAYGLRIKMGLCKAVLQHLRNRKEILDTLLLERYDMAIDLQPFFPNSIPLLKKAGIPLRIGYPTGGFGAFLTHPFHWRDFGKYLGELHVDHLQQIGLAVRKELGPVAVAPSKCFHLDFSSPFFVVQMCSSRQEKNWGRENWITLIRALTKTRSQALLVGQGAKDFQECEIVSRETGAVNACDRWSISQYAEVLKQAKLLITVDSMSVHLARLHQVPTVVALVEMGSYPLWIPTNKLCKMVDLTKDYGERMMIETSLALMQ